jgi:hypothetical protein
MLGESLYPDVYYAQDILTEQKGFSYWSQALKYVWLIFLYIQPLLLGRRLSQGSGGNTIGKVYQVTWATQSGKATLNTPGDRA